MVYHIPQFFPDTLKKLSSFYHKTPPQSLVQKKKYVDLNSTLLFIKFFPKFDP